MSKDETEKKDTVSPARLSDKVSTAKFRMLSPEGVAVEQFIFATTAPEEIDNLIEQTQYAISQYLGAGFVVPNIGAATKAVASAGTEAIKEKFGVREGNELFHCVSMDVDPQRDGRTKVSFFGNTFKQPRDDYASASLLLEPADMQTALAKYYKFKIETLASKIGTFAVDFYVETYQSSKLTSTGKPYVNVPKGGIHVAEGAEKPAISTYTPPPPAKEEAPEPPAETGGQSKPDDIPF